MGATRPHKIHLITVLIDLLSLAPAPTSFSLNNILSSHQIKLMRLSCTFPLTKFPNKTLCLKIFLYVCLLVLLHRQNQGLLFLRKKSISLSLFWPVRHSFDVPVKLRLLFLQVIISTSSSHLLLLV